MCSEFRNIVSEPVEHKHSYRTGAEERSPKVTKNPSWTGADALESAPDTEEETGPEKAQKGPERPEPGVQTGDDETLTVYEITPDPNRVFYSLIVDSAERAGQAAAQAALNLWGEGNGKVARIACHLMKRKDFEEQRSIEAGEEPGK